MGSTDAYMIVKNITGKLFATTSREWQLLQFLDLCTDTSGKEGLSENSRPGLIPAMRPDCPEKPQWFVPQDPLWVILFLRLKGTHLDMKGGVFDGDHYGVLCVKVKLFSATRDHKCPLEVFKRLTPYDIVCFMIHTSHRLDVTGDWNTLK